MRMKVHHSRIKPHHFVARSNALRPARCGPSQHIPNALKVLRQAKRAGEEGTARRRLQRSQVRPPRPSEMATATRQQAPQRPRAGRLTLHKTMKRRRHIERAVPNIMKTSATIMHC